MSEKKISLASVNLLFYVRQIYKSRNLRQSEVIKSHLKLECPSSDLIVT